jgi:hypothetical protein
MQELHGNLIQLTEARNMWKDLSIQKVQNTNILKQKPGDIPASIALKNIDNDLKALEQIIEVSGLAVLKEWERRFDVTFKFLKQPDDENQTPDNQLSIV